MGNIVFHVIEFGALMSCAQTIVQLLESEDEQLTNNIRSSTILTSSIRQLAASPPTSRPGTDRRPSNAPGGSDEEFEDDGMDQDGSRGGDPQITAGRGADCAQVGSQHSDHAALRASVHRALSGGQP